MFKKEEVVPIRNNLFLSRFTARLVRAKEHHTDKSFTLYCQFLSVSRYIQKIADISSFTEMWIKNNFICKTMSIIIRKISQIIRGQCLLMDEMIDL
ncbi:hypothetical protein CN291_05320 [Bacillus cereus]|nr:hypothetical protein CN291_05320 [Bacillus cereus]